MKYHKKVIGSESTRWRFFDFVQPNGTNPVEDWYQELSEEAKLSFDSLLKNISKTKNQLEWTGFRGFLKGKYKEGKIWELGFRAERRAYRILGVFEPERNAVLLAGCFHKQRVYTPTNALDSALDRAIALTKGRATRHERKIKTDF